MNSIIYAWLGFGDGRSSATRGKWGSSLEYFFKDFSNITLCIILEYKPDQTSNSIIFGLI